MAISILEQVKAQARVLVPLIKALREELGVSRANAIVQKAIGNHFRQLGRDSWQRPGPIAAEEKLEKVWKGFAAGDALRYDVRKKDFRYRLQQEKK